MKTLFQVAYMMVDKAEFATFDIDGGYTEYAAMVLFTYAVLLVLSVSALRWFISTALKFLKK